jgi:hypothetical protein
MVIEGTLSSNSVRIPKGSFCYFANINNLFDELFYQQLFSYLKSEVERPQFKLPINPETGIKIEMMEAC